MTEQQRRSTMDIRQNLIHTLGLAKEIQDPVSRLATICRLQFEIESLDRLLGLDRAVVPT